MQKERATTISRHATHPPVQRNAQSANAKAKVIVHWEGLKTFNRIAFCAGSILLVAAAVQVLLFNSLLADLDAKLKAQTALMQETNQRLFQRLELLGEKHTNSYAGGANTVWPSDGANGSWGSQGNDGSAKIRFIQEALKKKGFYPGDTNGRFDKNTKSALQKFQSANNLPPEGELDKLTLELLGVEREILKNIR